MPPYDQEPTLCRLPCAFVSYLVALGAKLLPVAPIDDGRLAADSAPLARRWAFEPKPKGQTSGVEPTRVPALFAPRVPAPL